MKALSKNGHYPSLFDSFFGDLDRAFRAPATAAQYSPAVEVRKGDDAYTVRAVLPNVKKEDLNVSVEDGYLKISGKSQWKNEENSKDVYSEIVRYESFERSLRVDQASFDIDRIDAKLENGVLEVTLPVREAVKPKQIEVKVN